MKKSLLVIALMFILTQANAAERLVIDIFVPLTLCGPVLKPDMQLKQCEH